MNLLRKILMSLLRKILKKKFQKVGMSSLQLELDPGLHRQIYTYHVDQRDEIWRRYIKLGPYQPHFKKF